MTRETELVTLKTRVPRLVADRLGRLAAKRDRSLAAELRRAIDAHLTDARKVAGNETD